MIKACLVKNWIGCQFVFQKKTILFYSPGCAVDGDGTGGAVGDDGFSGTGGLGEPPPSS